MNTVDDEEKYRFLVIDSGPIIRLTGLSTLWKKAQDFYTVPAVLQEIRDARARQHLETLPFDLNTKDPSPEGMQAVVDFARQTGDYQSLSVVDLQILALTYDLEREACGGHMDHIRKTPKRVVGVGKVETLVKENGEEKKDGNGEGEDDVSEDESDSSVEEEDEEETSEQVHAEEESTVQSSDNVPAPAAPILSKPSSWAALVNPSAASTAHLTRVADQTPTTQLGSMKISGATQEVDGQFSDADSDATDNEAKTEGGVDNDLEKELASDFPSLFASLHVPYEGSDNEVEEFDEEMRKKQALAPISKSGKLYNSFGKYKKLLTPKPVAAKPVETTAQTAAEKRRPAFVVADEPVKSTQSRIIGAGNLGGQEGDFEDDGEGWITTVSDIRKMKSAGVLDPKSNPNSAGLVQKESQGPPISQRAACTTTDFAMQNVILQMNMELLSVDGVKVRKLKSWVQRCGACFKVYTNAENTGPVVGKRLFCDHCGSNMIQRIACSVESKTGRLRLHLSKNYKHNLRGTKFSLPKPGTGNRFQGDLLLAEDQLMTGAWNQKVKMRSGGKAKEAAQSMFGRDIASNVGCNTRSMTEDDIRVGFGRRNPNAVKGRERRGKKKKSVDKACGLRRY